MSAVSTAPLFPPEFARRYRAAGYWTDDHFATFLATCAERFPQRTAATGRNQLGDWVSLTYAQLADSAARLASRLHRGGVRPGDFVLVQLPNRIDYLQAIFAVFHLGARPIFTLPAHRDAELRSFTELSDATALITMGSYGGFDYRDLASRLQEEFPQLTVFVSAADPGPHQPLFDSEIAEPWQAVATDTEDIAFLQVSGGTTGTPKLIPRSHADYLYSVRRSVEICELSPETVFLVVLPASHNFTMSSPGILGVLFAGGQVVLSEDPSPSVAFDLIEKYRVSMTAVVPPLALVWLELFPVLNRDASSLQVLQVGGAKFTPESARRVEPELGCRLQQVFGMAEGLVNYTLLNDPPELITTSQGHPMSPADEVLVLDPQGNPVAPGERGVLWTRGPYTIRGYVGGADASSFSEDGFYCTGDVVRQLPSGYLVVEGRDKDQINRAGEKISPEEIEDHLVSHPAVRDAAVVGLPDDLLGERTCAYIVLCGEATAGDASEIRRFLHGRGLAAYKIPDHIEFAHKFPLTGVGKVSRKELRARLAEFLLTRKGPHAPH